MEISKILRFVENGWSKDELEEHIGKSNSNLSTLLKEGSVFLENGYYFLSKDSFTESILRYRIQEPLHYLPSCESTNSEGLLLAEQGWTGVVVTQQQRRGRGRLGRQWYSSEESLCFSLVQRLPMSIQELTKIPLFWSALIADEFDLYVKWPNDIIDFQHRKIGGILSSVYSAGDRESVIVVGIGFNCLQRSFPGDIPNASSLFLSKGDSFSRVDILIRILDRLRNWRDDGFELWKKRSLSLGRRVKIGDQIGIATGLNSNGALMVDGKAVLTGELELLEGMEK